MSCEGDLTEEDVNRSHSSSSHTRISAGGATSYNLFAYIAFHLSNGINLLDPESLPKVCRPNDTRNDRDRERCFINLDEDDGIIVHVRFTEMVRIKQVLINAGTAGERPRRVRIWVNRPHALGFDECQETRPDQEFETLEGALEAVEYPVKVAKFSNVSTVTLYLEGPPSSHMRVFYLGFRGESRVYKKEAGDAMTVGAETGVDSPVDGIRDKFAPTAVFIIAAVRCQASDVQTQCARFHPCAAGQSVEADERPMQYHPQEAVAPGNSSHEIHGRQHLAHRKRSYLVSLRTGITPESHLARLEHYLQFHTGTHAIDKGDSSYAGHGAMNQTFGDDELAYGDNFAAYDPVRLNMTRDALELLKRTEEVEIRHIYEPWLGNGFAGQFGDLALAWIRSSQDVDHISVDHRLSLTGQSVSSKLIYEPELATWGLQRVSQAGPILKSLQEDIRFNYTYCTPRTQSDMQEVVVYILDTGINGNHTDFGGRAKIVAQFGGYKMLDGNGHGTHVAGTVGGRRWGIAKNVTIRAVKVLDDNGEGANSDIIAAIQYVINQYDARQSPPTVISISLGGPLNTFTSMAVKAAHQAGIHVVAAAGNENQDACNLSPAGSPFVITVGSSSLQDERSYFSNYGPCVTLFAPGEDITSSWVGSHVAVNTIKGTSMATPHVSGMLAFWLSNLSPGTKLSPDDLKTKLTATATSGMLKLNLTGSALAQTANLMLNNGCHESSGTSEEGISNADHDSSSRIDQYFDDQSQARKADSVIDPRAGPWSMML